MTDEANNVEDEVAFYLSGDDEEEEESDENCFEDDYNKMVKLTKEHNLNKDDLLCFLSNDSEIDVFIVVPIHLLNKSFHIFTFYFTRFWKISFDESFCLDRILETVYDECPINNFLLKMRDLYLNISDVDNSHFSLLMYSFSVNGNGEGHDILINENIFKDMLDWCNRLYRTIDIREFDEMNHLVKTIGQILLSEYLIKSYHRQAWIQTTNELKIREEQKRKSEVETSCEETNKKSRPNEISDSDL